MKNILFTILSIILFSCTKEKEIELVPSISVTYDSSKPYHDNFRTFIAKTENTGNVDSISYIWVINVTDTIYSNINNIDILPKTGINKYIVECNAIFYYNNPYFYKLTLSSYTILYIQ